MARNKFQAVKDVVSIELHIQKYESDLHPEGNSLIGSHHTHQSDGGRCLTVDTNNNQFKCWNCEITGSVIDYEADRLGIDIYAAAQELADVYNITLPDENPEQRAARKVANEKRASVQELMKEAFMLYHGNLPSENYFPRTRDYRRDHRIRPSRLRTSRTKMARIQAVETQQRPSRVTGDRSVL